jgi:Tol biopolymer transport system component
VVNLDGSGLKQITPPHFGVNSGIGVSWSPDGTKILLSGSFLNSGRRGALWTIKPDGTGLRTVPVPGCGGLFEDPTSLGCLRPAWSPDGTKIVFDARGTRKRHIYTVNADGSGLIQITSSGLGDSGPDWGTHPLGT